MGVGCNADNIVRTASEIWQRFRSSSTTKSQLTMAAAWRMEVDLIFFKQLLANIGISWVLYLEQLIVQAKFVFAVKLSVYNFRDCKFRDLGMLKIPISPRELILCVTADDFSHSPLAVSTFCLKGEQNQSCRHTFSANLHPAGTVWILTHLPTQLTDGFLPFQLPLRKGYLFIPPINPEWMTS